MRFSGSTTAWLPSINTPPKPNPKSQNEFKMVSLQLVQKDRHQIWAFSVEIQLKTLYMKKPYVVQNSAPHDTGFTSKKKKTTQKLGSRVLQTHRHQSFKEHIEAKCSNLESECYKDHLPIGFIRKQKTLISHYSKNRFLGLFIHLQHGSHDLCGRASCLLEEVRGKTKKSRHGSDKFGKRQRQGSIW
jgi:hypothetical protein